MDGENQKQGRGVTRRQAIRHFALVGGSAALAGCLDVLSSDDSVRWQFTEMAGLMSRPTVVDGTVYVGSVLFTSETPEQQNAVYALDVSTGETQWTFTDTAGGAFSSPVVTDGTLYVVSYDLSDTEDPTVHAIDTQTGTERWRYTGLAGFRPPLLFADGTLLAHGGDTVHGVQATGGEKSWQFSRPDTEIQRLRAGDGRVFVSTTAGGDEYDPARRVYALDSETGTGLWDRAGSARVYTDATLYGADPDGGIQAVDVETGDRRWLSRKPARGTLVVADTTMYRVESDGRLLTRRDTADVPEDRATVHAIDTATMTARWERRDVSYTIRPTVADDTLFLSTAGQLSPQFRDLEIIGLDTATGERTWGWPVPGGYATTVPGDYATTSPIVVDGTMYIGTSSGSLYAVETDTDGSSRDSATLHGVRGHHGGWVHGDGR